MIGKTRKRENVRIMKKEKKVMSIRLLELQLSMMAIETRLVTVIRFFFRKFLKFFWGNLEWKNVRIDWNPNVNNEYQDLKYPTTSEKFDFRNYLQCIYHSDFFYIRCSNSKDKKINETFPIDISE